MQSGIYAIYDNLALMIVGILTIHRHERTAERMFADVAQSEQSQVAKHPEDFSLIRLGYLDDEQKNITPDYSVIMTGRELMAALTEHQPRAITLNQE